jgi:hypothetical protein
MSYRVLLVGSLHHKNENAILKYKNIELIRSQDLDMDLNNFDLVFCPGKVVDVSQYPNVKFIFGPHFSVFPEQHSMDRIRGPNSIYVQPSQWVVDLWKNSNVCNDIIIKPLPFGVDTDLFSPVDCHKENIFIYFKRRNPEELEFIKNILDIVGISYRIFVYGSYSETDYLDYLQTCKYGIWLDAHESQGFALQEALSINVPLFVWNVRLLSQEYMSSYPDVFATTIPYWDPMCGEVIYDNSEFNEKFLYFVSKLSSYTPREFVLKELSIDVCEKRFIEIISDCF